MEARQQDQGTQNGSNLAPRVGVRASPYQELDQVLHPIQGRDMQRRVVNLFGTFGVLPLV